MSGHRLRPGLAIARSMVLAAVFAATGCGGSSPSSQVAASPRRETVGPATSAPAATHAATPVPSASAPGSDVGPAEAWIVYQLWNGRADIRLVRPDGTGDHPLLPASGTGSETIHPDWSPDGDRIAYVADNAIWVANVDGSEAHQVSTTCPDPCLEDFPAWSPDGSSIAYARSRADGTIVLHGTIVVVDLATGSETVVLTTDGPEYPAYPRWSPAGSSMVVALDRFPDMGIDTATLMASGIATFDVTTGAGSLRRLAEDIEFATYPDWSPDGERIVFSAYDLGYRDAGAFVDPSPPSDLYVVAADGSGLVQLTHNESAEALVRNRTASGPLSSQPTWSPDGSSIIFVQTDGSQWPGWGMAVLPSGGGPIAPASGLDYERGTHPRLRPLP